MNHHFYASSVATHAVTNDKRDLPALMRLFESEGLPYSVWYVPLPSDAHYQVECYAPKVEGCIKLGTFNRRDS